MYVHVLFSKMADKVGNEINTSIGSIINLSFEQEERMMMVHWKR